MAKPISAPAWPCHCDERGIGKPGVTCGDCPRDYGHTVDSAPSGEPAPTRADLIAALTFYATCGHMNLSDESAWDTVSGEPPNWLMSGREDSVTMVENGQVAKFALEGVAVNWIDGDEDETPQPLDTEVSCAA